MVVITTIWLALKQLFLVTKLAIYTFELKKCHKHLITEKYYRCIA